MQREGLPCTCEQLADAGAKCLKRGPSSMIGRGRRNHGYVAEAPPGKAAWHGQGGLAWDVTRGSAHLPCRFERPFSRAQVATWILHPFLAAMTGLLLIPVLEETAAIVSGVLSAALFVASTAFAFLTSAVNPMDDRLPVTHRGDRKLTSVR
eukprot:scaffold148_cov243-Pinguiococcus_pyrenoidosus.AAC.9